MFNISHAAISLSLACVINSVAWGNATAANGDAFQYPYQSPVATLTLVNTPTEGIELLRLGAGNELPVQNTFSINTDSEHRALFKPGNSTLIQQLDPQLGKAMAVPGSATIENTWVNNGALTENAQDLISYINNLSQHGLNPNRYKLGKLQTLADSPNAIANPESASKLLSESFTRVAHAIGSGITDPTVVQKEWDRQADTVDPAQLLKQVSRGLMDIDTAMATILPKDARYQGLKDMLQTLEGMDPSEQIFVEPETAFKADEENESVVQLKRALLATGDLKEERNLSDLYDTNLKMAVQRFQLRHGLETSGIANKETLAQLNVPLEDRIAQVRANLERWRWFPSQLEDSHLMVNIPEYRVRMMHNGDQIFEQDVVVGKPKHMTPVFSETMKQVVFAPTWTVPGSITNDELIPIEKRSPGYLLKEEIDFFVHGSNGLRRIDRSLVTAETLNQRPFPYILRQRAGDKNVLGKVKFMFPNKHAVYMHDTQAKKLFGEPQRAFSHGCIRLSNPDLMAYVIMQLDGYQQNEVNDFMALKETTPVNLDTHIPVHIAYFTAWQDEYGMMHFRKDIYKQDERLTNALNAKQGKIDRMAAAQ